MEKVTDAGYKHTRKNNKILKKKKKLDAYHNLYAQSDTLLPADVFKKFRNYCIEIF